MKFPLSYYLMTSQDTLCTPSLLRCKQSHVRGIFSSQHKWDEALKTLSVLGKSADYQTGHALIYKSIQVAEYLRQMDGQPTCLLTGKPRLVMVVTLGAAGATLRHINHFTIMSWVLSQREMLM